MTEYKYQMSKAYLTKTIPPKRRKIQKNLPKSRVRLERVEKDLPKNRAKLERVETKTEPLKKKTSSHNKCRPRAEPEG